VVVVFVGLALLLQGDAPPQPGYQATPEQQFSGQFGASLVFGDINDAVTIASGYDYIWDEPVPTSLGSGGKLLR
jgi:hypothetical protein